MTGSVPVADLAAALGVAGDPVLWIRHYGFEFTVDDDGVLVVDDETVSRMVEIAGRQLAGEAEAASRLAHLLTEAHSIQQALSTLEQLSGRAGL